MDVWNADQPNLKGTNSEPVAALFPSEFPAVRQRAAALLNAAASISLAVTIFFIPFRFRVWVQPRFFLNIYPDYTSFILYLPDISLAAALLFWSFSLILHPKPVRLQPAWLTLPLAGITLVAGASSLASADQALSLYTFARLLLLFGFYLLVLNQVLSLRLVTIAAGATLGLQAVVGITQVIQQHSLGLANLQELSLDPKWKGVSIVWSWAGTSLRAYGLTDHPNILGGCLAITLILLILAYCSVEGRLRILLLGMIALGCTALLLTFSRSAWLGLVVGLAALVAWLVLHHERERGKDLLALGVALLLVMAPVLWQNATYLGIRLGASQSFTAPTPENQAINERFLLDGLAVSIFQAHPLTGVGVGAFPIALNQFKPDYPFDIQPPHLVLLDVAAETGVLGGLFYLLLAGSPWFMLLRNLRRIPFSIELAGVTGALLVITVISLFDYYPWMLEPGRLWQWLLWGLWGSAWMTAMKRRSHA